MDTGGLVCGTGQCTAKMGVHTWQSHWLVIVHLELNGDAI